MVLVFLTVTRSGSKTWNVVMLREREGTKEMNDQVVPSTGTQVQKRFWSPNAERILLVASPLQEVKRKS